MRHLPLAVLPALTMAAVLAGASPAFAGAPGGTAAPTAVQAGGSEYVLASRTNQRRPVVTRLSVPRTAPAGRPPRVSFRVEESGVGTVAAQVTVVDLSARRTVISVALGWVHTGRTVTVRWPSGAALSPGSYQVSLSARDHRGATLLRRAHSSGQASLTVTAPPPAPPVPAAPAPTPAPTPEAGVPSPAQTAAAGAVFPVAGAHSFGDSENRFGAPRGSHTHQGQDVLTAEGTPVVAPMAGTILTTSYQAGGAGYYVVEHTEVALDFMFAHCQAGSVAVATGQAVSAGQALCGAGQTGSASTPHLHFEIWVGGWQASSGHPIDPLAYLEAWDRTGPTK
jgi:murein DD-endopeptidase MepM/ murein hydrolase activator NlpD